MTEADTVERVDLDVNLDETIPCSACEADATWRGRRPCCDYSEFMCDEHHEEVLHSEKRAALAAHAMYCKGCRAPYKPNIWTRI